MAILLPPPFHYPLSFFSIINSFRFEGILLPQAELWLRPCVFAGESVVLWPLINDARPLNALRPSVHSRARPAIQLMNASVSPNYLSPCFVPTQIFVATIAVLLPGAEHSTVEEDKKVCVANRGDVKWPRSKSP